MRGPRGGQQAWAIRCGTCGTQLLSEDPREARLYVRLFLMSWRWRGGLWRCPDCEGVVENIAGKMLAERMQRAFAENPRGELYRTLPQEKLVKMLEQNVAEVKLALQHNNDVEDKLADCGNYCAFLLRNHVDPLTTGVRDPESLAHLTTNIQGMSFTPAEAERLALLIRLRTVTNPDTDRNRLAHER